MKRSYSQNTVIEHNGERKTLAEWAEFCGIGWKSMWARLQRMTEAEAIELVPFTSLCVVDGCMKPAYYDGKKHCNTHHYRIRRNGTLKLKYRSDDERFWEAVKKSPDGCWMFSKTGRSEYGCVNFRGKSTLAHRVSWIIHNGEIPDGMLVCHKCDNPGCVNPNHLFLGTHRDNALDMHNKGRANPKVGSNHPNAKLNEMAVVEIRRKRESGAKLKELAEEFGVEDSVISCVVLRKTWKHVA